MKRVLALATFVLFSACGESPTKPTSLGGPHVSLAVGGGNSLNAKACQKNGWQNLVRSDGTSFSSEEACVSYAAKGVTLYKKQTITFNALAGKTFGDADFNVSATASSGLTVTFTASGNCTVSTNTVHLTGAGSCTITAHQAGSAIWYPAADVAQSFAIARASQTISFTSTNPSPVTVGGPSYTPTAAASSGLTVDLTLDGTSSGCTLAAGVVSFGSTGTCVINANQAGNTDYNAAPQVQQSITINAPSVSAGCTAVNAGTWNFAQSGTLAADQLATLSFGAGEVINVSILVNSTSSGGGTFHLRVPVTNLEFLQVSSGF